MRAHHVERGAQYSVLRTKDSTESLVRNLGLDGVRTQNEMRVKQKSTQKGRRLISAHAGFDNSSGNGDRFQHRYRSEGRCIMLNRRFRMTFFALLIPSALTALPWSVLA